MPDSLDSASLDASSGAVGFADEQPRPRLLADIGATNARFAWQYGPGAPITQVLTLACADYPGIDGAIFEYLRRVGAQMPPDAAVAIANPVDGDRIQMTNHHWSFSIEDTRRQLGLDRLRVVNDFTALALALPTLAASDLRQVGGGQSREGFARALLGAGSGLGVSGLLPDGRGGWVPLQGEGGHVTLAGRTAREDAVIDVLGQRYGHPSAERACSGPGLVAIEDALRQLDGMAPHGPARKPAQVLQAGLDASDPHALEALQVFCAFLGTTAGNLALTLGALGGIYIGGGIVPRLGAWFDASPYRERLTAKGRFGDYLAAIPTFVIVADPSPALAGAAAALDR